MIGSFTTQQSPADTIVAVAAVIGTAGMMWLTISTMVWRWAERHATSHARLRIARWTPRVARQMAHASLAVASATVVPACTTGASGPSIEHIGTAPSADPATSETTGAQPTSTEPTTTEPTTTEPTTTEPTSTQPTRRTSSTTAPTPSTTMAPTTLPDIETESAPEPSDQGAVETTGTDYVVEAGDSFWSIAEASVGPGADLRSITDYWRQLVEANRHRIASGNPDLIHPGEVLSRPPVPRPVGP